MATVKVSLSLDEGVVELLRASAAREGKPLSRYLADLVRADERRRQDLLAAQGYQELAALSLEFAEGAQKLAAEVWPPLEE